jgi:hypothetical protein
MFARRRVEGFNACVDDAREFYGLFAMRMALRILPGKETLARRSRAGNPCVKRGGALRRGDGSDISDRAAAPKALVRRTGMDSDESRGDVRDPSEIVPDRLVHKRGFAL